MVVASSNNNTVENISKEILLYSKIDKLYHKDLSYFKQLLDDEDKNNNWGIFAAALGNRKNKKKFINKFWKYKDEEERDDKEDKDNENYTMLQYLNLLVNNKCKDKAPAYFKPEYCNSIDETNNEWQEACADFHNLYIEIHEVYENIASVIELNKKKRELIKEEDLGAEYAEKKEEQNELELELDYKSSKILEIDCEIKLLNFGFFEKIHAFFKTAKYNSFYEQKRDLIKLKNKFSEEIDQIKTDIKNIKAEIKKIEASVKEIKQLNHDISLAVLSLKDKYFNIKDFEEDVFWKNWQENFEDLNKVTPYFDKEFEKLRSKLFISAVRLHEIFINANADNFWHSLKYFVDMAMHSSGDPKMNEIAWQNFFMIIPVVSTTFHSFDRMFAAVGHNEIPWLFIDEAGQIPPQYAASAIYKSNKVVVVGDPLQTEPISILKQDLIKKLCEHFKVSYPDWSPSEVSLQNLADRNSLYQTKIDDVTVGFPLLVHRRCQNPMFNICNKIAYGNKMIFATSDCKSDIRNILGISKWINVKDNKVQRYKYESEAESQKLLELLKQILKEKDGANLLKQIYIITMYKDYSESIRRKLNEIYDDSRFEKIIKEFGYKNIGTIHAFQGKENDTVIVLLGAQHPLDKGARNIMTKKPNVLNVGISRAKNNLYIVGNSEIWLKHKYMKEIYNMLGDKE